MKNGLKTCLIIASITIPGVGLVYSVIKNRQLKNDNDKLSQQNKRLEARMEVLEKQNKALFEALDEEKTK